MSASRYSCHSEVVHSSVDGRVGSQYTTQRYCAVWYGEVQCLEHSVYSTVQYIECSAVSAVQ